MNVKMASSWKEKLNQEFDKPYFVELAGFVKAEYATRTIYPLAKDIFSAFECCSFESTRVVILGQDPYHGAGQANGLCFSVNDGIKSPPSLVNIFKEVKADLQIPIPSSGNLMRWAQQGVLLLNATLTVRDSSPGSHQNMWGAYAQKKGEIIDRTKHCVLTAPHPSPFSANRGFLGCKHFSMANAYLKQKGFSPINW